MTPGEAQIKLFGLPVALTSKSFGQLIIVIVVVGFAAVMAAGAAAALAVSRDQTLTAWVTHTILVQKEISNFDLLVERSETARRGYLLSRDPAFIGTYQANVAELPRSLDRLTELTVDNSAQQSHAAALRDNLTQLLAASGQSIELVRQGGQAAAIRDFLADRSAARVQALRDHSAAMAVEEDHLLGARRAAQRESVQSLYFALGVAAPLLVLVAIGSTFVIFRYTRDLASSGEALRSLNEGLEAAVAERTEGLARANEEIQRFAYIVSHDLRSPLVNVMGFTAELETTLKPLGALIARVEQSAPALMTPEAVEAVRVDVPEAIGFIRASTQKMDRLINAILNLSRSGRRTLKPELLDMEALLADVVGTLKTTADAAGAQVLIDAPLPTIVSDRLAVEQVFANLLENAIKYLKPGRAGRIDLVAEQRPGWVVFEVKDNGRGIDARDHERIFELFRRAGQQDRPGEGIGLANVRAIVYRLRGVVELESTLDQGTTFRVLLPPILRADQEIAA